MTIKKLVAKIEEFQKKNAEEYLELQDPERIAYAEGRGDALRWVLAVIEEGLCAAVLELTRRNRHD